MTNSNAAHWYPTAAYLYVLHLDDPALAWEYLRRNPDYGREWIQQRGADTQCAARRWGLRSLVNPACDAREVQPDWTSEPHRVVHVGPDNDTDSEARFHIWHLPGRKCLTYDGERLVLTCQLPHRILRVAISTALEDGMTYAFSVPAGAGLHRRWRTTEGELALFDETYIEPAAVATRRPGRTALLHSRSLQALDGLLAGASQRSVAEALFGETTVAKHWHDDGELRAQVRRVIRRGKVLMHGGYRRLLPMNATRKGRSH
jgi:hypothetical protein